MDDALSQDSERYSQFFWQGGKAPRSRSKRTIRATNLPSISKTNSQNGTLIASTTDAGAESQGSARGVPHPGQSIFTDDAEGRTIFPDIIVHMRQTDNNLTVIEVKKHNNNDVANDEWKLQNLTSGAHAYRFGVHVSLNCPNKLLHRVTVYGGGKIHEHLTRSLQDKVRDLLRSE